MHEVIVVFGLFVVYKDRILGIWAVEVGVVHHFSVTLGCRPVSAAFFL